jgi:hypothetical protein
MALAVGTACTRGLHVFCCKQLNKTVLTSAGCSGGPIGALGLGAGTPRSQRSVASPVVCFSLLGLLPRHVAALDLAAALQGAAAGYAPSRTPRLDA